MLPTSRNTTYIPGSKIKSQDLNDLQDMIVGGKHGQISRLLGAAAWQPKTQGRGLGGTTAVLHDGHWQWGGAGPSIVVCDVGLVIPVGGRLVSATFYYNVGGAGLVTYSVYTRDLLTGAADVAVGGPTTDNTGAAWESGTLAAINYTLIAGTECTLEFNLANAAHRFGGAAITWDKL